MNTEYRLHEAQRKHVKCLDSTCREKEKEYMKTKCLNYAYTMHEAEIRSHKWSNLTYKNKHAQLMCKLHSNKTYKQRECIHPKLQHKNTKKKNKAKTAQSRTLVTANRNYGKDLRESIQIFHEKTRYGCIFVHNCCHQTNFEDNVIPVNKL